MCVIIPKNFERKHLFPLCPKGFFFLIFKMTENLEAILNWKMEGDMCYILVCPVFEHVWYWMFIWL